MARCRDGPDSYHQHTKHHPERLAAGPNGLSWATQPEPFRYYGGSPALSLDLPDPAETPDFRGVAAGTRPPAAPLGRESLGRFLGLALALSAWKRYGPNRWALRCNPSSGNLHPTEGYVVTPAMEGLDSGVYHYQPRDHALEQRCRFTPALADELAAALPEGSFLVVLTGIPWREAWKYGERAWRYCLLDSGHALGALTYSGACLGWSLDTLEHWPDEHLAALAGLAGLEPHPDEREYPELACLVSADPRAPVLDPAPSPAAPLAGQPWQGRPNRLSPHHEHRWERVDEAATAAAKPATPPRPPAPALPPPVPHPPSPPAGVLIRRRRSAQDFDPQVRMPAEVFFRLLDHCLPRAGLPPWGLRPPRPEIHLALFVHRVDDLEPGLYVLARDAEAPESLRRDWATGHPWSPVPGAPGHLPLYHLTSADLRYTAAVLACQQSIAGNGLFSLAMVGDLETALARGPWGYRELLREAGQVGQALYLEAEAAGRQGTGIGCFFDDGVHDLLGITGTRWQVVYMFTVGRGVPDPRIASEPAYGETS